MYKILKKRLLVNGIYLMDIEAKRVAKSCKPGQFVIVRDNEKGERIPLTICDYDSNIGSVTIVFQAVGVGTIRLSNLNEGDFICDFVGPLGQPSEFVNENIEDLKNKKILFIAGGVGTAPVYPQVKYLKNLEIDCDVIIGARNKDLFILTDEIKLETKNLYLTTDDGSNGNRGLVTDVLKDLVVNKGIKYDLVIAIGPMIMMKFVSLVTKELGIKTIVSLNPIMVDGTGMCGACRVTVGDTVKFACVDGPEFDGHLINFDEAIKRQAMYKSEEGREKLKLIEGDTHKPEHTCEEAVNNG